MISVDTTTNLAPKPVGLYPHSKRVGGFLFLSGIGPRDPVTGLVPGLIKEVHGRPVEYDFEVQVKSVFQNIKTVLTASGYGWEDLVDITVFLTDMKRDFKKFNEIYSRYFSESQPCRTTVEVQKLPTPIAIELKCVAFKDPKK